MGLRHDWMSLFLPHAQPQTASFASFFLLLAVISSPDCFFGQLAWIVGLLGYFLEIYCPRSDGICRLGIALDLGVVDPSPDG